MQPLHTTRLDLLPCCAEDVDALHALWIDPDVRRYLWDDVAISRQQAAEVVQAFLESAQRHGFGLWLLYQHLSRSTAGQASSGTRTSTGSRQASSGTRTRAGRSQPSSEIQAPALIGFCSLLFECH